MFTSIIRFLVFCIACWPLLSHAESAPAPNTLSLGILPYMSARTLINTYEPLRLHLEKNLGRPVKIYTSTSFKQFFTNCKQGEYDLVISAPNFARMLQTDNGFIPLVRYGSGGQAVIMVPVNSPVKSPQQLHGKTLAVPDKLAIVSIVGLSSLREAGIKPGVDLNLIEVPSFASAILSTTKGETDAAISAQAALSQMPQDMRNSVRTILTSSEFISQIFMANPKLHADAIESIKSALLAFGNVSGTGKVFLEQTGFKSIIPVTQKDMHSLDAYANETRQLMEHN